MVKKHDPPLILIADDVMPTTVMLERVFEYEGYQVKSVYDGEAAIEAAQLLLPDLILLDINMPNVNGFDVLRTLRNDPKTASIPTILITAMGDLSNVVQGLNLGADDYLRKPFNSQELLARAKSKMRARKLEESLQNRTRELEALLRVSEELSQHLQLDELLAFILYLVTDMIPCNLAGIFHLDDDELVDSYRVQEKDGTPMDIDFDGQQMVDYVKGIGNPILWPEDTPLLEGFESGIVSLLQYAGAFRGVLLVVSNDIQYDENDLRLLNGMSRSASLAIRNAELYEIQINYAQNLEDMVQARTKELESTQDMLVRSEKLASVGRLAATVAHEIKNPLFPIRINLEGMIEDLQIGNSIDHRDIERTLESVERIKAIVDRLLGFTGNWQVNDTDIEPVDINSVIDTICNLNQKFFQQENIVIERNYSDLPPVYGYRYQLEHVFMNLSLNAKDAIRGQGFLKFSTSENGQNIIVKVEDNGAGIDAGLIGNIFEPFVSTKQDGNGLGLFISYNIIKKHGGTIDVESRVNKGTTFTIRLPTTGMPIE